MSGAESGAVKAWILAFAVLAGIGIGTLVGVGCLVGANACPGKSRPKPATVEGIYLADCAVCHGRSGEGTRAGPSLVSGEAQSLTPTEITSKIERGKPFGQRGSMPAFRDFTPQQLQALAAYVVSLRGGA